MCDLIQYKLAVILLIVSPAVFAPEHKSVDDQDCFCKLSGVINDCPCEVETVDEHNNAVVYPLLKSLIQNDYFRYFRVNLQRECPFWPDDSKCALRDCHVNTCTEDQLPNELKGEAAHAKLKYQAASQKKNGGDDCGDGNLGGLDKTISDEKSKVFANWTRYDDLQDNFCELDDESSHELEYVDLMLNPERYTGYKGDSAHRIWSSIYDENCFQPEPPKNPYGPPHQRKDGRVVNTLGLCLEKRVFYRVISGMHASINIHLTHQYLLKESPFGQNHWGPNMKLFQERFGELSTDGEGPERLKNLYFLYLLMMRALVKAAPYLEEEVFFTGSLEKDAVVRKGVKEVLRRLKSFPKQFDERRLFRGVPAEANILREEFKSHFRNISRIMDCVGCDKCKLWGKIQTQGIGTALKILFSGQQIGPESTVNPNQKRHFQLRRSEISSLFSAFAKYSSSIYFLDEFRQLLHS